MNSNKRVKRHLKVRRRIIGTADRPRLAVFRSARFIYAQIIDDAEGKTVVALTDIKEAGKGTKTERAYKIGMELAKKALAKGVKEVVFDRGGFLYHGRVAKVAEGAREGGLKF